MRNLPTSRLAVTVLSGLLTGLMFCACVPVTPAPVTPAQPTATVRPSPSPTPRPTLGVEATALQGLEVETWHAFSGEALEVFEAQVGLFNATNDWGLAIRATGHGDYLTLLEAMNTGLDAGEEPALVVTLPEQALEWETAGQVVEMQPYLDDAEYGLEEGALADIPAAFLGGPGLPAQRSARYLLYNQTWARELGFPDPPQKPEDFRTQACAANAAFRADASPANDVFGGWVVDSQWQTVLAWMLAFDGGPLEGEAYQFQSTGNQAALEFLKGLYDDNCAWLPEGWLTGESAPFDSFAARRALFVTGDLGELPTVTLAMGAAGNADEWTLLPFPGGQGPVAVAYGPQFVLLRSSPEEQLGAWLFVRWVLSTENQALWTESTGLLPLRTSVLEMIDPYRNAFPQWEAAASALDALEAPPSLASWRRVRYVLEDGLRQLFLVGLPMDQIPILLEEMQTMAEEFSDG